MRKTAKVAFVVGVSSAIAFAVIALVSIRVRTTPAGNYCVANLRQLDGAKQIWALENNRSKGDPVTWEEIKSYVKVPLICSRGGSYILGRVGELPRCSTGGAHTLPPETNP